MIGFLGFNICMLLVLFAATKLRHRGVRLWVKAAGLLISTVFLLGLLVTPTSAAMITEYWYPPNNPTRPWEVANFEGDRAFYTAQMSNRIGLVEFGPGKFTEWVIPTTGSNPWGIAVGPEIATNTGAFAWFTESVASKIGRLNPITGEFVEWNTLTSAAAPYDIAIDSQNLIVYFTEFGARAIGKLTYVGGVGWRMTQWPLPVLNPPFPAISSPLHLTVDNGGIVWFTASPNYVGRLNPFKGEFTIYSVPSSPKGITFDKDGFIWFTSSGTSSICRLNWWKNQTVSWQIPTSGCDPSEIVVDDNYNVWFTEFASAKIGKFVSGTGDFYEYPTPTPGSQPYGLTQKDSQTLTFAEAQSNRIGRLFQPAWMAGGQEIVTTTVNFVSHASTSTFSTIPAITSSTTTVASSPIAVMSTVTTTSTQTAWSSTQSTISETSSVLFVTTTTTGTQTSTTTTVTTTTTTTTGSQTSTSTETSTTTTTTSLTSTTTTTSTISSTTTVTYPTTSFFPTITSLTVISETTTSTSTSYTTSQPVTTSTVTLAITSITTVTSTAATRRCIIASAAYGSELAPDVQLLRIFRDSSLQATFAGSAFMGVFNAFYYSFSTTVADFITQYPALQAITRALIYPLIATLRFMSAAFGTLGFTTELAAVASGVAASALIGAIYITPIIAIASLLSKKLRRRN